MSGARRGTGRSGRHVEKEVGPEIDPGARRKTGEMSEDSLRWNYSNSDEEPEK
ncbi:hypothetical protein A2U01_0052984 [Trifolium medium]|uniref:Uncharacterized protein n=1 Tax=Trifolium medium TaxID=97028 RepID=A0A392R6R1_9FABA|nr:hypothetical protein [Trifolium medium]